MQDRPDCRRLLECGSSQGCSPRACYWKPQLYGAALHQRVHVPNNWVLGFWVIVIIVLVLVKYMIIRYLGPQGTDSYGFNAIRRALLLLTEEAVRHSQHPS